MDDRLDEGPHENRGTAPGPHRGTVVQIDSAAPRAIAVQNSMSTSSWLSSLTQHGSKPPVMLKVRSSDAFIIGTVSLAVFTVSSQCRCS